MKLILRIRFCVEREFNIRHIMINIFELREHSYIVNFTENHLRKS